MQNVYSGKNLPKLLSSFLLAAAIAVFAGCSDNTASSGTTPTPTGATTAASIQLLVSSQQMLSSATASTVLTALALDANGQAIADKTVTFSKGTDSTAYFTNVSATTDANGVATATLNIGTNMANRVVSVSATVDTAVGTNLVTVTGTTIAISGNTSLAISASSTLTVIVKDSTGVAVPDITLAVTSQNGNPIVLSPATGITDATGQITATATATNAGTGTDVLTVTGAGASQTQILTINSASFAFTAPVTVAPATTPEIVVNTATPVSVLWTVAGVPQAGVPVNFYSSRGTITGSPATTNASGIATASVSAGSTGATIITASGAGGTPAATLNVVFVTTSAGLITAQASPSTVAVNTSGSTTNQSVISVTVRDVNNNLVKNAHVTFSLVADASGGSLAAGTATTDITGTASVNYIAGSIFSPQNGVQISATVDTVNGVVITPITTTVNLTVAAQALYVRLGTDNIVYLDTPTGTYSKKYLALVTDSAGNPAPDGTQVRFVLRPTAIPSPSFSKGRYIPGVSTWVKDTTVGVGCVNEDANLDGIKQAGEDLNGNGFLDPIGVATVNPTSTTVNGFTEATITYPKSYATWVQEDLEARTGTVGNDPPAVVTLVLPGAAADYADLAVAPPGQTSPFGVGSGVDAVCTNTN
ncbi:MAG: Ig-like domain-containing protein [Gallionella sp.]|nr:Ig-like domain-containing protein [Gallionella sp.]